MARVALIGTPQTTWKEWVFRHREGAAVLIADPVDAHFGPPGRLSRIEGERLVAWTFFGALNVARYPNRLLAGVVELAATSVPDLFVQFPAYRPSPSNYDLYMTALNLLRPDRIVLDDKLETPDFVWKTPIERVALEPVPPQTVQASVRKAQWHRLRQSCDRHTASLAKLRFVGGRMGSGLTFPRERFASLGLQEAVHVERCGGTLLIVANEPIDDWVVSRALDATHAQRAHVIDESRFQNLLCAPLDDAGQSLGIGFIEKLDFERGEIEIVANSVAPAPIAAIALGSLYVSPQGIELGETKPYEL